MKSRPAETGAAIAAAVAVLIAWIAHIKDATVVAAMAVVVGFIPAAITWTVSTVRKPRSGRRTRREHGYGVIELLFAILLVIVLVWLIVFFASRI